MLARGKGRGNGMRHILKACLFWLLAVMPLAAHEVRPAVGDLEAGDGIVTLTLRLNAEAILAGVDLGQVINTDESEQGEDVDALRRLEPAALAVRLTARMAQILAPIELKAGTVPLRLDMVDVAPGALGNPELPRDTTLTLQAALPPGAQDVALFWPSRYGLLILRQQGVDEPYTGYLSGQWSDPIGIAQPGAFWGAAKEHAALSVSHLAGQGLDHVFLALALALLALRPGVAAAQATALVLGAGLTPVLAWTGTGPVTVWTAEVLLAGGVLVLALDNLVGDRMRAWRLGLVAVLGLSHGAGMADTLHRLGVPPDSLSGALAGFHVTLALGQITVLAIALVVMGLALRQARGRARVPVRFGLGFLCLAMLAGGYFVALPILWGLAVLGGLSLLMLRRGADSDAWRHGVSAPASGALALLAGWGLITLTLL